MFKDSGSNNHTIRVEFRTRDLKELCVLGRELAAFGVAARIRSKSHI